MAWSMPCGRRARRRQPCRPTWQWKAMPFAFSRNAMRPGPIHTDIHASGGEPNRIERVKSAVPMQRGGDADEVARAILWLLSDEASYCTGALLDVSGGR